VVTFAAKEGTVQQPNTYHKTPEIVVDDQDASRGFSDEKVSGRLLKAKRMLHSVIRHIEEEAEVFNSNLLQILNFDHNFDDDQNLNNTLKS